WTVNQWRRGQRISRRRADRACADNDVAESIAALRTGSEFGIDEPSGRACGRSFRWRAEIREASRQLRVRPTISFDGFRQLLERLDGVALVLVHGGAIPFDFERGQIEQEQADGKEFPSAGIVHED